MPTRQATSIAQRGEMMRLMRKHTKWGADYVLKKLSEKRSMQDHKLPSVTTIWRYWCSFEDQMFPKRDPSRSEISPSDKPLGV